MPDERRTKIICTIGPASQSVRTLRDLVRAGMDVARINFSHGDLPTHERNITNIRKVAEELNRVVAILQDLQGPRLRIGDLRAPEIPLEPEATVALVTIPTSQRIQEIPVQGADLSKDVRPGNRILIEEGLIELVVDKVSDGAVYCRVLVGGVLRPRKGINVPGVTLSVPTITDKDRRDLAFGVKMGVDFVALSFVRSADDLRAAREILRDVGVRIPLIAKIEKHEAVDAFDSILEEADGAMVARGDLGVEIRLEAVPIVQKAIIRKCNQAGKPVITATQMLNSMMENPRPTRAEVSDVANAIFDGTDAVMLSGETAVGRYPLESVRTMARIAVETEGKLPYEEITKHVWLAKSETVTDSISRATVRIADELGAKAIVTMTTTGYTARMVARNRPRTPIIAATPYAATRRQLALTWGVQSPLLKEYKDTDELISSAIEVALAAGVAAAGDRIVITGGIPLGIGSRTNFLKVHTLGEPVHLPH